MVGAWRDGWMDELMNEVVHSRQGLTYVSSQVGVEDWLSEGDKLTHGDYWEFVREESCEQLTVIEASFFNRIPNFRVCQRRVAVRKIPSTLIWKISAFLTAYLISNVNVIQTSALKRGEDCLLMQLVASALPFNDTICVHFFIWVIISVLVSISAIFPHWNEVSKLLIKAKTYILALFSTSSFGKTFTFYLSLFPLWQEKEMSQFSQWTHRMPEN